MKPNIPPAKDKTLFTPGPLTMSLLVKQAMLHDAGSWHFEFIEVVRSIREKLLEIARLPLGSGFVSILMQGSGTFGVEAVMASLVPPDGRLLVLANGAYGERIVQKRRSRRTASFATLHRRIRFWPFKKRSGSSISKGVSRVEPPVIEPITRSWWKV